MRADSWVFLFTYPIQQTKMMGSSVFTIPKMMPAPYKASWTSLVKLWAGTWYITTRERASSPRSPLIQRKRILNCVKLRCLVSWYTHKNVKFFHNRTFLSIIISDFCKNVLTTYKLGWKFLSLTCVKKCTIFHLNLPFMVLSKIKTYCSFIKLIVNMKMYS